MRCVLPINSMYRNFKVAENPPLSPFIKGGCKGDLVAKPNSAAGERGYVLVMALVFTIIMSITGMALLYLGQVERSLTLRAIRSSQALLLAEAGVERTIWRLRRYPDWRLEPPAHLYTNEPLGGGSYSVLLGPRDEHRITVTSTGRIGNRERAIQAELVDRGALP